jgi:alpha-aminoadipate carrier protein LysW
MQSAVCSQCGSSISVGTQPKLGKLVTCSECGTELEIVWLNPLELDFPLEEDEYDEDDYDNQE